MFEIKRLWIEKEPLIFKQWKELLEQEKLNFNEAVEYSVGIFDEETLIATGSYHGNILKYLVVHDTYQDEKLITKIVTHLLSELHSLGINHIFVYTNPKNRTVFCSLGFKEILKTGTVLFMEQGTPDFTSYQKMLTQKKVPGESSAIVMNANPFTRGHQYLVEQASKSSNHVYVFVLSENQSFFSVEARREMVELGVESFGNVTVLPTENYIVSSVTFPTYFLKERAPLSLAKIQAEMDARLFKERIAPLLEVTKRYVGEEPYSKVTDVYNEAMKAVFDEEIELVVLPRLEENGAPISATIVRAAIVDKNYGLIKKLLPSTSFNYLLKMKLV